MGYIFISYSHKDQDYAHELYKHLFEQGLDAWVDDRLDYGSRWPDEIERRVNECSAFVLVMSSNSRKSDWVQNELHLARKLNKTIYTLLLEGDNWWHLQTIQYFDVRNGEIPSTKFFVSLANVVSRSGSSPNISINVAGVVTGNIVVGNDNNVQSTIDAELEIAREKAIREAKEKADREAAEKAAREAAEQTAREKAIREAKEKAEREAQKQAMLVAKPVPVVKRKHDRRANTPASSTNLRWLGIGGVVLVALLCGGFGLNYLINNLPVATSTPQPTKTPIPTQILSIGSTLVSEKDGMVSVYVPAGKFTMGSDLNSDEKPVHQVDLNAFWIDQTEVTNAMYEKCVDAGKCTPRLDTNHYSNSGLANHPVVYVNWNMANAYCSWADRRLPTEAEWEKAARGTDGRTYPWGNDAPNSDLFNYIFYVSDTTDEVGTYPSGKSFYEAYDMAGNVWEWVSSLYQPYPYDASDGREDMSSSGSRVLRGDFVDLARSAARDWSSPSHADFNIGFRCARTP